jgi:AraC-like DNA-binding protein
MLDGRRAQVWRHQPSFRRPRHFHAEPEINLVLRGWAKMGVGAGTVELRPGDLIFLSPAQDHVMLEASEDLELFVLAIRPELADRLPVDSIASRPDKVRLDEPLREQVRAELVGLGQILDGGVHEQRLGTLFQSVLCTAPRGQASIRRGFRHLYVHHEAKAQEVADQLGIHVSELSRRFFGDVGVRFVDARARLRLIRFVASVDQGASLTTAAFEHFGSYAQCHRVFRRCLGCSPRDYFAGTRVLTDEARFE